MLPLFLECQFVLSIWLVEVPRYAVLFTRIVLLEALIGTLQGPMITALMATGKIKWYQIVVGGILLLNLPVAYLLMKLGGHIAVPLIVSLILVIIGNILRLVFSHNMIGLSYKKYVKNVILPIIAVTAASSILPIILYYSIEEGWMQLIAVTLTSITSVGVSSWTIVLNNSERRLLTSVIKSRLSSKQVGYLSK